MGPRLFTLLSGRKLSEKGYEHCFERGFRSCTEAKKREKYLLGGPQSHAVDASGAFRTVSVWNSRKLAARILVMLGVLPLLTDPVISRALSHNGSIDGLLEHDPNSVELHDGH